jgi:hypothetical protein
MGMRQYVIRSSRYVNGELIHADVRNPAIIELDESVPVDPGLTPVGQAQSEAPVQPHYAVTRSAHETIGKVPELAASEPAKGKGKRPSDGSPV